MVKTKTDITQERTTFKPFKYPWAYDAWLQHEQSHWLHTEVPMSEDVKDYKKLTSCTTLVLLNRNSCKASWMLRVKTNCSKTCSRISKWVSYPIFTGVRRLQACQSCNRAKLHRALFNKLLV